MGCVCPVGVLYEPATYGRSVYLNYQNVLLSAWLISQVIAWAGCLSLCGSMSHGHIPILGGCLALGTWRLALGAWRLALHVLCMQLELRACLLLVIGL